MSQINNQSKQNRTHVIAVRVTEAERDAIELAAYQNRKRPPRILLDAFFQQQQQQEADSIA